MITDEQARRGGPDFLEWLIQTEGSFQVELANISRGVLDARKIGRTELHFNRPPEQGRRDNEDLLALLRVNGYRIIAQGSRVAIYWGEQQDTKEG